MEKRVKKSKIITLLKFAVLAASLATVCGNLLYSPGAVRINPHYLVGTRENRGHLRDLFTLLAEWNSADSTFAIVREIANNLAREGEYQRLIHFLSGRTINYPGDPFNSYYLLMIAYAYQQMDSLPVAIRYFDLIVRNYPDLIIAGESIHLTCLQQLVNLTDDWGQRVWYYQEMISRFPGNINLGSAWFMLAQAYERTGDWTGAIQAYTRYLPLAGSAIPGFPNAREHARQQVDLNNSPKDWTFESLPALVAAVQNALEDGNATRLMSYQTRVSFFIRSWEQRETVSPRIVDLRLAHFMRSSTVHWADRVETSSNANEAFLRTWGWPQISTWYFYFRKINFPADPEIHGRWEWAGIYYGEKF